MTDLKSDLASLRIEREPEPVSRRWLAWLVVLVLVAAIGIVGWRWFTRERPLTVEVATVSVRAAGEQAAVLNASGYVTARRRATVSSRITGRIMNVYVEEGMAVREGQVLARLDDSTHRAALALAEAQAQAAERAVRELEVRLDEAQRAKLRSERLLEAGANTVADLDQIDAEVESLRARIDAARSQVSVAERQVDVQRTELDNTVIRAPFAGVALSKDAQPGEMVSPISAGGGFTRTGICTLVDMSSLEIEVDVNESYINRVRDGQSVTAVLDAYPDWQIPAHVITTVPTADRQTATVLVRIAFEQLESRILPDMGVKVTFLREEDTGAIEQQQPVALVPRPVIVTAEGQTIAFVVTGDTVERRVVRTGGVDGTRIEVVSGLRVGERVVLSPPESLAAGRLIEVAAP